MRSQPYLDAEKQLAEVLTWLEGENVPPPDETRYNWAKWTRRDGGCIIFRANYRGDWGDLDVHWREDDGGYDGLFAPRSYDYLPRLARDIRILIALANERVPREVLERLGRS